VGKIGILDRILLLDYRFLLVLVTTGLLYFRPSLSRPACQATGGARLLRQGYTISIAREKEWDWFRLGQSAVIGLLAWLAAGLLPLLIQSIPWPLIHDAPIMHYIAWRILHGAVPYRDVLDMNLPGVYLIHVLELKIFGMSDGGWRLFDFLWLAVTDCLLWQFCFPRGRWWALVAVLLYSAFHVSSGAPGMGQRDYLEFTFLLGGLLLAVRAFENGLDRRRLFLAGLALGYAMSIKPLAALLLVAVACMAAQQSGRDAKARATTAAVVLGGGLVFPAIFTVWLAAIGGLKPFLAAFLGVMPLYSKMHDRPFVQYVAEFWPLWLPCILSVPISLMQRRPDARHLALILGVVYGTLHYLLQGKGWLYQFYPLVGFTFALTAYSIGTASRSTSRNAFAATALTIFFIFAIGSWEGRLNPADALTRDTLDTIDSLQRDLGPRLGPGVTVQSFDTTGGCSHALMRMNTALPTPFLCDFLFYSDTDQPYVKRIQAEFMADMQRHPPTYLVFYRWGWPSGQYERLARFPELQHWIHANYRVEITRNKYVIYTIRAISAEDRLRIGR